MYWRGLFPDEGQCFIARSGNYAVGMARVVVDRGQEAATPMLKSLWADPAVRGRGIASALVRACAGWVRTHTPGLPLRLDVNPEKSRENLHHGTRAPG